MDFLIHWPPGPVVATVQCQGLDEAQIPVFSRTFDDEIPVNSRPGILITKFQYFPGLRNLQRHACTTWTVKVLNFLKADLPKHNRKT